MGRETVAREDQGLSEGPALKTFWSQPSPQRAYEAVDAEIRRRGHSVHAKDCSAAYVRLVNYGGGQYSTKQALWDFAQRKIPTVPESLALELYDNKLLQIPKLRPWLPHTDIFFEAASAREKAKSYPFVSKSAHGSASKNVRLIETPEQAEAEIRAAFGAGIPCQNGKQFGYLIWQRFIPGNDGDVRVCVIGDYLMGLTRDNRRDMPFASGSGSNQPITRLNPGQRLAFEMASDIADALGSRWCCFDFVFEGGQPFCLEVSFAWSEPAYAGCVLFERDLTPTSLRGSDWPSVVVDELERLADA